jgi:hypothetical protein
MENYYGDFTQMNEDVMSSKCSDGKNDEESR